MKYPPSIPLWHANGEPLSGKAPCRIVLSSAGTKWNDVVVEQQHYPGNEMADVMFKRHVIIINVGNPNTWESKKEGRFQRVQKARGAISFFPSDQPFSGRLKAERGVFANFLILALNPAFMSRTAVDWSWIQTVLNWLSSTKVPTLHFATLLWHCGPESRPAMPLTTCM
jgi:hypothetical protein